MRAFVSSLVLAAALLVPGCVASPDDVALARGELDNVPGEIDTSCHVDTGGGGATDGKILDGTRNGLWCCGVAECTDRELCGDDYGSFVEACAVCNHYECIPGSGLALDPTGGEPTPPVYDPRDVAELADLALERPASTVIVVATDVSLLETVDYSIERDLLGRASDGQQCEVVDVALRDGVLRNGSCCGLVACTDVRSCPRGSRVQQACVSCDREVCLTTTAQRRR